ncbi:MULTISPECIES: hypothetical protein [Methylobacterium]|jgi:hypothetical protein|uniref:Uncharacterized protein n=1 Tax=Methylobacterium jeotgali TaxID=381630 RepID=A0ABQ4SYP4_9HYPH|nr:MULTISPECIES: hypothetical protein [Methylobacterium]GBU16851.1 hypothetical protein AwMethylo_10660 [Methylobacterium sp.]GJE08002.1 hypothetical protein AOPFMNJM_3334 [Methylobacterium jeotgali]
MSTADVIPFRGSKPLPVRPGVDAHPLPWVYSNGFIWDANRRVVGSTVQKEMAEWIVRSVNASHGHDTPSPEPGSGPA